MEKIANICLDFQEYESAIKLYEQAEVIAVRWDLRNMITDIMHNKFDISIKDVQYKQAVVLNDAISAEKMGKNAIAIQKYLEAADYSSSLFTLGVTAEGKKMREYINKARELKKTLSWKFGLYSS